MKIRTGIPTLRGKRVVREVERSFTAGRRRDGLQLVHYSLQSNDAHLIVEARDPEALGRGMKSIG